MRNNQPATLAVSARAPFHIYYEGPALAISGTNQVGKFDVLPGHADFFSVMTPCEVTIDTLKETIRFEIVSGIIGVHEDEVMLFVNL